MSGETKTAVSGWTVDTLNSFVTSLLNEKELRLDERFIAQEKAVLVAIENLMRLLDEMDERYKQRFDSSEKAIMKAETATEKRFESVNEFRSQLADQAHTFMPRSESEAKHLGLIEKIDAVLGAVSGAVSRAEYERSHSELYQALATINSRLDTREGRDTGSDVNKRLDGIAAQIDVNSKAIVASQGRIAGFNAGWAYLVGAIGASGGLIGIAFAIFR